MAYLGVQPYVPTEELDPVVDFTKNAPASSTITSCVQTSINLGTGLSSTATIINGSSTINGYQVTQRIHGALNGENHLILWTCTFSTGRKVVDAILMVSRDNSAS